MSDYKIKLGVSLDTSDLRTEINKIDGKEKVKLGVDVKVNDIRERISAYNKNTNNAKLNLKVKLDTDDLKRQINSLNLSKNADKGIAIPVNTQSLENSLREVKDIIESVKKSIGTIDDKSGIQSLVASVNQIATALGKAENESDNLVKSLNALSKKDFSINVGFNTGGSNSPIARNVAYGQKVRNETLPELKRQADALVKYVNSYYKTSYNELEALQKLVHGTKLGTGDFYQNFLFGEDSVASRMSSGSLSGQMQAFKQYIDMFKQAAALKGLGLDSVTSQFSKTSDELIRDAQDIQTGAKQAKEGFEQLKGIFGASIDVDSLSNALRPISDDIKIIREALEGLSKGVSIDGLTQSFKELSGVLDTLAAKLNIVQDSSGSIGNVLNGTSGQASRSFENVEGDLKQVTAIATNSTTAIDRMKETLSKSKVDNSSIDAITKDLQDMNLEIQSIVTKINGNDIRLSIKGTDKFGNIVTSIKEFTDLSDGVQTVSTTVARSFDTSADAANRFQKEVDSAFTEMNQKAKQIGSLEFKLAGLDPNSEKDIPKIKELENQIESLKNEYRELDNVFGSYLSDAQIETLSQSFQDATNKVKILESELAGASAAKELDRDFKELVATVKQIDDIKSNIFKLDATSNQNEILVLTNRLKELEQTYQNLFAKLQGKLPDGMLASVSASAFEAAEKLELLEAKAQDTKIQFANDIVLKINAGQFDEDISKIDDKFGKLSSASIELESSIDDVKNALIEMENASHLNDDEAVDVNKLTAAYEKYVQSLKKANNLLRTQTRKENAENENLKLIDDRKLFQSDIDVWLKNNSAAAKMFGASMNKLKLAAESCDRVTLNRLRKQFKLLDNEADKAGLKVLSVGDRIKNKLKEYSAYFSVAEVFMYVTQGLKDMFDQVVAIDKAMTELKKVTNETDASYSRFLNNASSKAKEIGTTIDGFINSTADFARLGYNLTDAENLAEVANIYAVVGDDIDSVDTATKSLISTMTAFGVEASNSMSIVDKFNIIGNNFAISSGGIGEALERSASSMAAANNSLDETIALITAANTVVNLCHAA